MTADPIQLHLPAVTMWFSDMRRPHRLQSAVSGRASGASGAKPHAAVRRRKASPGKMRRAPAPC